MSIDVSKVKRVKLVIFQPRIKHEPDEWETSKEALENFAGEVRLAVQQCANAEKKHEGLQSFQQAKKWQKEFLKPGEKQCKWCKAKDQCSALANECLGGVLVPVATTDGLEDLDSTDSNCVVPDDVGVKNAIANVVNLDFSTIEKIYENRNLFSEWLKAVENRMLADMLNGTQSDNWKLVQGRGGNRKWSDEDAVYQVLSSKLEDDEIYEKSIIGVAKAEKLFKKLPDKWEKLQSLITKSEGGPTVAPINDKRQAIAVKDEMLAGLESIPEEIEIDDLI
jgi:uncharacterized protein YdcH (DUF465 family)